MLRTWTAPISISPCQKKLSRGNVLPAPSLGCSVPPLGSRSSSDYSPSPVSAPVPPRPGFGTEEPLSTAYCCTCACVRGAAPHSSPAARHLPFTILSAGRCCHGPGGHRAAGTCPQSHPQHPAHSSAGPCAVSPMGHSPVSSNRTWPEHQPFPRCVGASCLQAVTAPRCRVRCCTWIKSYLLCSGHSGLRLKAAQPHTSSAQGPRSLNWAPGRPPFGLNPGLTAATQSHPREVFWPTAPSPAANTLINPGTGSC